MHPPRFTLAHILSLAMICVVPLATGCGRRDANVGADSTTTDTATQAVAPAPATPAPSTQTEALDASDIDRWQKGMTAELEVVHKAGEDRRNAKTSTDTLNAMLAANETSTRAAGARAAGVDEQRYQLIRTTLATLAGEMAPLELTMNVSQMPASAVAELKKSRAEALARTSADLPPALVAALTPRAAELRKQDLALVAARLEAAGMAH